MLSATFTWIYIVHCSFVHLWTISQQYNRNYTTTDPYDRINIIIERSEPWTTGNTSKRNVRVFMFLHSSPHMFNWITHAHAEQFVEQRFQLHPPCPGGLNYDYTYSSIATRNTPLPFVGNKCCHILVSSGNIPAVKTRHSECTHKCPHTGDNCKVIPRPERCSCYRWLI